MSTRQQADQTSISRKRIPFITQVVLEYLTKVAREETPIHQALGNLVEILLLEAASWLANMPETRKWFIQSFENAWNMYFRNIAPPDIGENVLGIYYVLYNYLHENFDKARKDLGVEDEILSSETMDATIHNVINRILYVTLRSFFAKIGIS